MNTIPHITLIISMGIVLLYALILPIRVSHFCLYAIQFGSFFGELRVAALKKSTSWETAPRVIKETVRLFAYKEMFNRAGFVIGFLLGANIFFLLIIPSMFANFVKGDPITTIACVHAFSVLAFIFISEFHWRNQKIAIAQNLNE